MKTREAIERVKSRFDKWALDEEDLEALRALGLVAENEDERVRKNLISFIKLNKNSMFSQTERNEFINYLEKQKEQKPAEIDEYEIIKKHITRDSLSSEVNKRLIECGWYFPNEKPAEWSEEEKKLKEELFELISVGIDGEDHRQNYYNFLDTHLNPQPHWKPTEEQMRAFQAIIECLDMHYILPSPNTELLLKSLFIDLKKLI